MGTWNGAIVRYRRDAFTFSQATVTEQVGTRLSFSGNNHFRRGRGFYIDSKLSALDSEGEWYCDQATESVYVIAPDRVDPNTLNIKGCVLEYEYQVLQGHISALKILK